jgi:hypothetical protein
VGTIIGTVLGVVFGGLITYVIAVRVAHRSRLSIRLVPTVVLYPSDLDVHNALTFSVQGRQVQNICALQLEIECKGKRDVVVDDARLPRPPNATPLPRVEFRDFRMIGVRTLNNDASRFYIPLSRPSERTLYINIHRLRAGATARFQIVGELEHGRRQFDADQCQLFPGAIPDIDLVTSGRIHRPWLTR